MRKINRLSAPGVLVFLGQPAIFDSMDAAEEYALRAVQEGDLKFATIVENAIDGADRTVMESALVVANLGIISLAAEEAIKEGYLDEDPEGGS